MDSCFRGVSENTSDEEDEKEDGRSPRAKILLENPFDNTIKDNIVTPASVFNVPLMDRVKSESAVLERHVKVSFTVQILDMLTSRKRPTREESHELVRIIGPDKTQP